MSFTTKTSPARIDVECDNCGTGSNSSNTPFGRAVAENFPKFHKCPKPPTITLPYGATPPVGSTEGAGQ